MDQLKKDALRIISLEIQGAMNVALSAITFLSDYAKRLKCKNVDDCHDKLIEAKNILVKTRDTEPAMRNGLTFIMNNLRECLDTICVEDVPTNIENFKTIYQEMLINSRKKIAEIGARRIPDLKGNKEFVVMTHCHSSLVTAILLEAKKQGKNNFKVIQTETRPRFQGRKTANELLDAGIEVIHVVDSAMRWAVNAMDVNLILIGADSITSEGTVLNKIGSRLLALVAHEEHVPFYVASPLLKYNPKTSFGILERIEMREAEEIWDNKHKQLKILNPAFETVSRRYIDGLITEAGIFASSHVQNYFEKLYPELKEKD
ncbi:MAG: translation initiation factor eIF-2B [Promethearchaeota archaeon]